MVRILCISNYIIQKQAKHEVFRKHNSVNIYDKPIGFILYINLFKKNAYLFMRILILFRIAAVSQCKTAFSALKYLSALKHVTVLICKI